MKKTLLILAAALLVLSAGCAKKAEDPAQSSTLPVVTGNKNEIEITLDLAGETSEAAVTEPTAEGASGADEKQPAQSAAGKTAGQTTQAAAKGEAATTKASDAATKANQTTDKANDAATKANQTTAASNDTAAKAGEAAGKANGTTAPEIGSTPMKAADGGTTGAGEKATLPTVRDGADENGNETLPNSDSGKNRYELPAIPLN